MNTGPVGREMAAMQGLGMYTDQQIQKASNKLTGKMDKLHEKIQATTEHLEQAKQLKSNMSLKDIFRHPGQYLALRSQIKTLTRELKTLQRNVDPMVMIVNNQLEKLHTIARTEDVMRRAFAFKEFIVENPIENVEVGSIDANVEVVGDAIDARQQHEKAVTNFKEKAQSYVSAFKAKLFDAPEKDRPKLQAILKDMQAAVNDPEQAFRDYNSTEERELSGEQTFTKILAGFDRMAQVVEIEQPAVLSDEVEYRAARYDFKQAASVYVDAFENAALRESDPKKAASLRTVVDIIKENIDKPETVVRGIKEFGAEEFKGGAQEKLQNYAALAKRFDVSVGEGPLPPGGVSGIGSLPVKEH